MQLRRQAGAADTCWAEPASDWSAPWPAGPADWSARRLQRLWPGLLLQLPNPGTAVKTDWPCQLCGHFRVAAWPGTLPSFHLGLFVDINPSCCEEVPQGQAGLRHRHRLRAEQRGGPGEDLLPSIIQLAGQRWPSCWMTPRSRGGSEHIGGRSEAQQPAGAGAGAGLAPEEGRGLQGGQAERRPVVDGGAGEVVLRQELAVVRGHCAHIHIGGPAGQHVAAKEPLRMQYCYLDLRNVNLQRNLMLRSKVTMQLGKGQERTLLHGSEELR